MGSKERLTCDGSSTGTAGYVAGVTGRLASFPSEWARKSPRGREGKGAKRDSSESHGESVYSSRYARYLFVWRW